ncbi:fungal-specific transcription factor domain-containing protein [Mycena rosella]|uniref:Fungal-specific transcription factor domain-containing protein n=1 Tax=Mycena rosella TaxID=1033263 RepID=A0AAD7CUB3_MYCRO|nr:fungal-specific transcription factor domain-containing protein [Mycena rosella]
MLSNGDEHRDAFYPSKKRACTVCRRRKSRCNGSEMPGDKCSTCIDLNVDCTYPERTTTHAPVSSSYEALKARLEHSEALVSQLRAELATAIFAKSASASPSFHANSNENTPPNHSPPEGSTDGDGRGETALDRRTVSLHNICTALQSFTAPPPPPHPDDLAHLELTRSFERLSVSAAHERRFLGRSSAISFVKAAIDFKEDARRDERRGDRTEMEADRGTTVWHPQGLSRRLHYWMFQPSYSRGRWENRPSRTHAYVFPELMLTTHLIGLYFDNVNVYLPLLHRPTFERAVAEGLHLRNDGFAATLLLVCAVGSRWSSDPRVVADDGTGPPPSLSCGWVWFDQVPMAEDHLFGQATLYDLQYYCLAVQFLEGSSAPHACWTLIGVGLRLAQDVGAHRRSSHVQKPSVLGELWKRAFWVLVYLDRTVSSGIGRSCAIQHDDFDLDLPIECDDECWEHPTRPFEQPPGVPSRIAFFNALLRLNHILSLSLKTLYPLPKVRQELAVDDTWEENVVAELDSALNQWRDQVPEHLRWDSGRADPVFFDQSVALQCHYSHLQMLIHRPFIPMVRKSAPTALPSLAICTCAARNCASAMDVQRRRKGMVPVVFNLHAASTSGIVLLLNVWSGKRTGLMPDPSREMATVHKCMEIVRLCEDRSNGAPFINIAVYRAVLYDLASVSQLPLPNSNPNTPASAGHNDEHQQQPPGPSQLAGRSMSHTLHRTIDDGQFRPPNGQPGFLEGSWAAFAPPHETWFPPEASYALNSLYPPEMHVDPAQASSELEDMMALIDSDTIAMWANAPTGFEVDDWGNYFNDFGEIMQGQVSEP